MSIEDDCPAAFLSAAQALIEERRRGGSWESATALERRSAHQAVRTVVEALQNRGVSLSPPRQPRAFGA